MIQPSSVITTSLFLLGLIAGCGEERPAASPPAVPEAPAAVSAAAPPPQSAAPPVVSAAPPPPAEPPVATSFHITGGTPAQQADLGNAITSIQKVWKDEGFWDLVKKRHWLPGPKSASMKGEDVVAFLHALQPEAQPYFIGDVSGAVAVTSVCGRISIGPTHVTASDYLLNTVAHENTHTLGQGGEPLGCNGGNRGYYRFTDRKYNATTMPWLVSYAIGDLAECSAEHPGNPAAATACFEHRINGQDGTCRLWEECCRTGAKVNVVAIRKEDGRCPTACAPRSRLCAAPPPPTAADEAETVE